MGIIAIRRRRRDDATHERGAPGHRLEKVAYIEGDTFWSFIGKGQARQGRMQDSRTFMLAMTAAAAPHARNGYEVILDFAGAPRRSPYLLVGASIEAV